MVLDRSMVQPGMEVVSADLEHLGKVSEVRGKYFVIHEHHFLRRDETYYIPRDVIQEVIESEHRVILNVRKRDVERMGWDKPPGG